MGTDLGIPALDGLFVLETDPTVVVTSGEDESEGSGDSQGSESVEDEESTDGGKRMWRWWRQWVPYMIPIPKYFWPPS